MIRNCMSIGIHLACIALLAGCAAQETAGGVVKEAVATATCDGSKVPQRPAFPADVLTGKEDIFTIGSTLWADRKARQAYELPLEAFYAECSKR